MVVVAMPAVPSPWRLVNVIGGRICYNARDLESDVPSQEWGSFQGRPVSVLYLMALARKFCRSNS